MDPHSRKELFDEIFGSGMILPASAHLAQSAMEYKCLTGPQRTTLRSRFPGPSVEALETIVRYLIRQLPLEGSTRTHFTCLDLLAGDLDRIFLSVEKWYEAIPNGFVFDAERLVLEGAAVRPRDLLWRLDMAFVEAMSYEYPIPEMVGQALNAAIEETLMNGQFFGKDAIVYLRNLTSGPRVIPGPPLEKSEVVWNGPLPLEMALEAWREGEKR